MRAHIDAFSDKTKYRTVDDLLYGVPPKLQTSNGSVILLNISNERTSVRFSVIGIEGHHSSREAARALSLTCLPESLRTLEEILMEEDVSMTNSTPFGINRARQHNPGTYRSAGQ